MKRKLLITTMALTILTCTGCSNTTADTTSDTNINSETVEDAKNDSVAVEKNLFSVTLTIPASYAGETTQETLDNEATEKGYKSAILNDDGSVTYKMSKSQHKKLMKDIKKTIDDGLAEMIGTEDYPDFKNIQANDDYTSFTITTTTEELNMVESFSVMSFYIYGGMYNVYNGTDVDNIHVEFINAETGEVFSSSDSKDTNNSEATDSSESVETSDVETQQ